MSAVKASQIEQLEEQVQNLLLSNLVTGEDTSDPPKTYTYICPDKKRYPHQWLWDSCFHIIVNSHLNVELARRELETLLKGQREDGLVPHMIYWKPNLSIIDKFVKRYYLDKKRSSLTQTPLLPQALRAIYLQTRDPDDLETFLPRIKRYYDFLYETRRFSEDPIPLLNIIHSWESGIDNSPIYDKALGIKGRFLTLKWMKSLIGQLKVLRDCNWEMEKIRERDYFLYKDLLFNCAYIQGCRDLSFLYEKIGQDEISKSFEKRAKDLEKLVIKHCWHAESSLFYGLYGQKNQMDTVKSAMGLIPLILDGLPLNKATSLVEDHLLNEKEFWPDFPVPSVVLDSPHYTLKTPLLWRGPTWININWFLIKGLRKHNFENESFELTQRTFQLVEKSGFREFYSPKTGKGMGAQHFGWSTLILDTLKSKFNTDSDFILNAEYRHVKKGPV
ncbi:MAG: hypothetical protein EU548_00080 [Promethearchaeota archaeon]|nr:MAG: hypothetical protein EU548_00080 [Candidatus Lokiarchaeota archaeon]